MSLEPRSLSDQRRTAPGVAKRPWPDILIDRVWRFFCSVRAAIWEIAFLAFLVLIGTLRGSSVPRLIAERLPVTETLVDRWYAWDVFHSLLFMALLALLAVAIAIGGMINRVPGIWKAIAHPTITTSRGFLHSASPSARIEAATELTELIGHISTMLKQHRYRVLTMRVGEEVHLYADKNRYAKLGTFPFHIALILIIIAGILGAQYGFRETEFIVSEGENRPILHGTDLSIRLDRFDDTYVESGAPAEYTSHITLLDDGVPVDQGAITVNHPLTYRDVVIYQTSFGQAVQLRVTDLANNVLFEGAVDLGLFRSSDNSDAPAGVLELREAGVNLSIIAPDEDPRNNPEADTLNLADQQVYVKARYLSPNGTRTDVDSVLDVRQAAELGPVSVEFLRETRFTLLQVARNPAIPLFVAASVMLLGGLAVTFYFPHRRIRGIVSPATGLDPTIAMLAPLARRDWGGQRDFHRILESLGNAVGEASVVLRESPTDARTAPETLPHRGAPKNDRVIDG